MNVNNVASGKRYGGNLMKGTIRWIVLTALLLCTVLWPQHRPTSKAPVSIRPVASSSKPTIPQPEETKPKRKLDKRQKLRDTLNNHPSRGLSRAEVKCALDIAYRESRYNQDSVNSTSGARGVFQLLHGKPQWDLKKQVQMATKYMKHRYGTWCKARAFHYRNGWW